MTLSLSRIPKVPVRPRRRLGSPPDTAEPVTLPPALTGLLALRHKERMRRAELRSLHPDYLNRVKRQLDTEIAVEHNLARGRRLVRYEIRRATDPALLGLDRHRVHFPNPSCVACEIFRPVLWGFGVLCAPFAVFFALALILLI